jgi:peptide chain release factor 1
MLDKLDAIKARFEQVGIALTNPEIINNQKEFGNYSKEYRHWKRSYSPTRSIKRC